MNGETRVVVNSREETTTKHGVQARVRITAGDINAFPRHTILLPFDRKAMRRVL